MVEKEQINKILTKITDYWTVKCPTISEMHGILDGMSLDEQYNQLTEQGLLNPLEIDDFSHKETLVNQLNQSLSELKSQYDETDEEDDFGMKAQIMLTEERLEKIEDELFQYGRRLIEGAKPLNSIPDIDKGKFKEDTQWGGENGGAYEWEMKQGELESQQIRLQKDSVKVDTSITEDGRYVDKRLLAMNNYFDGDTQNINYTISHNGYVKALDKEQRKQMKSIDSLMKDSGGLAQDTILYRGGYFDIHLRPGDHSSFKGYQSTSFQRFTSTVYLDEAMDTTMTYVIHAPKGTKGICGSDDRFYNNNWEHEYVLPRNQGFTVLNIDYDNGVVEIVLDE